MTDQDVALSTLETVKETQQIILIAFTLLLVAVAVIITNKRKV
jgi:cbb3-type cytochrome oxidase subunit 3